VLNLLRTRPEVVAAGVQNEHLAIDLRDGHIFVSAERERVMSDETDTMTFRLGLGVSDGSLTATISDAQINDLPHRRGACGGLERAFRDQVGAIWPTQSQQQVASGGGGGRFGLCKGHLQGIIWASCRFHNYRRPCRQRLLLPLLSSQTQK